MCVGEHVYRPSLLCDPVLDKIDNNNNNNNYYQYNARFNALGICARIFA